MTLVGFDREAWLADRQTGIGASDVAPIIGMSNWGSAWSVWADKVGLLPPGDPSEEMEFGQRAEPMLAGYFEDRTGLYVQRTQRLARHPSERWMLCTPDGEVAEWPAGDADPLGVVEFKTDGPGKGWDEIPDHYQIQVQWQLAVTELDRAWFGVLHGRRFRIYELDRDQAVIDRLVELCGAFWQDHVLTGIPPRPDGHPATSRTLGELWDGQADDVTIDHLAGVVEDLLVAKAELKDHERHVAELENTIKAELGDHTVGLVDGRVAVTWRPSTRRGIDVKALRAAYPRAITRFETATTSRRLLVKGAKP